MEAKHKRSPFPGRFWRCAGIAAILWFPQQVRADVAIDPLFGSHMVLQRDVPIPVFGSGAAGEAVTVTLATQSRQVQTGPDGQWQASFDPLPAGGPYKLAAKGDGQEPEVVLDDILMGDVWVASGQSNMERQVMYSSDAEAAKADPGPDALRLGSVKREVSDTPLLSAPIAWSRCEVQKVQMFSAAAYFFGRKLAEETHVPIGLVSSSWGGTPIESWTRREVMQGDPDFTPIFTRWDKKLQDYPEAKKKWDDNTAQREVDYQKRVEQAARDGMPAYRETAPDGPGSPHAPSVLWNGMIHPLLPLRIKGVVWYQGESNAGRAEQYAQLFPKMIQDWRAQWGQGDFPFYFVQIANFNAFRKQVPEPVDSAWAELREAQAKTRSVPNTGMAVAIDVGEASEIHPKNKKAVGDRLALLALQGVYGQDVVCEGPRYVGYQTAADGVDVEFSHVAGGLKTRDGGPIQAVSVAGPDHKFFWAEAAVTGNTTIHVKPPPEVPNIQAVRYDWGDTPSGNLANDAGLPAEPFRSDSWPGVTTGQR